jgi:hypothetical protein
VDILFLFFADNPGCRALDRFLLVTDLYQTPGHIGRPHACTNRGYSNGPGSFTASKYPECDGYSEDNWYRHPDQNIGTDFPAVNYPLAHPDFATYTYFVWGRIWPDCLHI